MIILCNLVKLDTSMGYANKEGSLALVRIFIILHDY